MAVGNKDLVVRLIGESYSIKSISKVLEKSRVCYSKFLEERGWRSGKIQVAQ